MKFLHSGLDSLVKNLPENQLKMTKQHFGENTDLFLRKGVFPYGYLDDITKLADPGLHPKKMFSERLNEGVVFSTSTKIFDPIKAKEISDKDYLHAQKGF